MEKVLKKSPQKILFSVVFFSILIAPICPKIQISEGILLFPYEFFLAIVTIFLLITSPASLVSSAIQKYYLGFCLVIFVSTCISIMYSPLSLGDLLRVFKWIIYTPVPYIVHKEFKYFKSIKTLVVISMFAMAINLIIFLRSAETNIGRLIFSPDLISEGLSSTYFNITNFSFGNTGHLSHGIWATYCAFAFLMAVIGLRMKVVKLYLFILFIGLFLANTAISISREGLLISIIVSLVFLLKFKNSGQFKRPKISIFKTCLFMITSILLCFSFQGSQIGMKIIYMLNYISSGEVDNNILGRINTWILTSYSFVSSPHLFLIGHGYNTDYYGKSLDLLKGIISNGIYSHVPESLIFLALGYGGLLGMSSLILLLKSMQLQLEHSRLPIEFILPCKLFLFGLLITNIFAGASLLSDLVLLHVLMLFGIAFKKSSNQWAIRIKMKIDSKAELMT